MNGNEVASEAARGIVIFTVITFLIGLVLGASVRPVYRQVRRHVEIHR